jgi:hypothetical protein
MILARLAGIDRGKRSPRHWLWCQVSVFFASRRRRPAPMHHLQKIVILVSWSIWGEHINHQVEIIKIASHQYQTDHLLSLLY